MKEKIAVGKISVQGKYDVRIYLKSPYYKQFLEHNGELVLLIVKIPENETERELLKQMIRE